MSKSDQKKAQQQTNQNLASIQAEGSQLDTELQGILSGAQSTAASVLPSVVSGYTDISSTGGFDPGVTGGIFSGYEDLATTGGISDADAQAMRERASGAATGVYQSTADAATRTAAATGGYGDSGAVQAYLSRQAAQAAAESSLGVDAELAQLRQSGKEAGLAGATGLETSIASGRLAGTGGLANVYSMSESEVQSTVGAILDRYKTTGQLSQGDLQTLTQLSARPGVFGTIMNTIGTLGGAAAGVIGAVAPGGFAGRPVN